MLNFKDWKLSSQDGTKATLKHANGHEMTIAMKALPKIQREQILRLAKHAQEFKDGGAVQKFPDGGDVSAANSPDNSQPDQSQTPGGTHITINAAAPAQPAPAVANPAGDYANSMAAAKAPVVASVPTGPPKGPLNANGQANPGAVAQQAQAGAVAGREADIATAKGAVPIEQQRIAAEGPALNPVQQAYSQFQSEIKKADQDIVINPRRYMEQMSAPKKALSALGLILGGIGAGQLGSTDNPALRTLNSLIDKDIDAQKTTFNNRKTVWGAYHDLFGDSVTTNSLAHATMDRVYDHSLKLLAHQIGTPAAWARYLQASAALANQTQEHTKNAALHVPSVPGYTGASYDTSAAAKPALKSGSGSPSITGKEGPINAKATPKAGMTTADLNAIHDQQGNATQAGIPASHQKPGQEDEFEGVTRSPIDSILTPGAEQAFLNTQSNWQAGPHKERIESEYKTAQQADQQLRHLNETYGQLIKESRQGGVLGRLHRSFDPESVPTGGGDMASGLIKGLARLGASATNTDINRLYAANKTKLVGALSSALVGTNVGDHTIHELVDNNAPEYGDSPAGLKNKLSNIEKFIRDHTPIEALTPFGIAKKRTPVSGT